MRRVALPFALAALLLAGCDNDNFSHVNVTNRNGDPASRVDFIAGISVPEGSVASGHLDFIDHDGDPLNGDLTSDDPAVLQVAHTTEDSSSFVFLGIKAGSTTVHVLVDGEPVASINATVTPPP